MRREFIEKQIEILTEKLAKLDRFGEEDPFDDGAVIQFEKQFGNGRLYSYAAIRADGLWYTTGPRSPKGYTWEDFTQFLADGVDEIWVAADWEAFD